jgi:alpha,alpha-trehalase
MRNLTEEVVRFSERRFFSLRIERREVSTGRSKPAVFTILRSKYDAVLFDLDGVVTKTAKVHAASWKELFDQYLENRAETRKEEFRPFDLDRDYHQYVDGKPRYEGVKSFLESRGIKLPYGSLEDPPDKETICGLGNKKNKLFLERIDKEGAEVYTSTVALLRTLRSKHFKTAIVSSSKNCADVLEAANLTHLFDTKVDGLDSAELKLEGKPAPDIFLEAARRLNVKPGRAIVLEDAVSGVLAGSRGKFGLIIGVDRRGHAAELKKGGADIVVKDLKEIEVGE